MENPTSTLAPVSYASVGRRWAAIIVDAIIMIVAIFAVMIPVVAVVGLSSGSEYTETGGLLLSVISQLLFLVVVVAYSVFFIGKKGQTPGKMLLKIKVVKIGTSDAPGYLRAFLREIVGKFISGVVFDLGYLWAIWDKDKQAWHDKIAQTVVIKV